MTTERAYARSNAGFEERGISMTLIELQKKLGDQIELLTAEGKTWAEKKNISENAMVVASIAKQMINNADVMLRYEKLEADKKLKAGSSISGVVK